MPEAVSQEVANPLLPESHLSSGTGPRLRGFHFVQMIFPGIA
jgi:hypothetical protein